MTRKYIYRVEVYPGWVHYRRQKRADQYVKSAPTRRDTLPEQFCLLRYFEGVNTTLCNPVMVRVAEDGTVTEMKPLSRGTIGKRYAIEAARETGLPVLEGRFDWVMTWRI